MLLKSLDHIFWLGRYLERLDDTARLINATSHLLIDSHKDSQFSWPLLLDVLGQNGAELLSQLPASDLTVEQQVMGYLITDVDCQVSIRAACTALKQNARTVRQLIPRDMWEELNSLDLFLQEHCQQLQGRQHRYRLMTEVSRRCQMVVGVLDGTMLRSDAFDLFNIGRHIERADMTTRIMDVMVLQQLQPTDIKRPRFRWTSILNALGGVESYHYYLAHQNTEVDAVDYLLTYADFPRSIAYCLHRVAASAKGLPHSAAILQRVWQLQDLLKTQNLSELTTGQLHQLIDQFQTGIIELHQVISTPNLEFSKDLSQQMSA
ncbi:alpha-E domain-containing protein [Rheinheimera sp. 1928-s]|uniref:alpha-E domain-containing protein n=1 Tax=Rheinheimera sp. 1928-s TaxID=3033803 RepID=UPI00260F7140|nr:alpha-E domain-containing protein [Rheinheimera sp. 1928-s]MDF3124064.1 alpha-E domain-containing protein [Rheinheimera sp. 1928-s]